MVYMMRILILLALIGGLMFYLEEARPEWYLKALTHVPLIDTSLQVQFDDMDVDLNEASLLARYDNLRLVCENEASKLGDRVCWTYISSFNCMPAEQVAFFFGEGGYRHLRVTFPDEVHPQLLAYLNDNFPTRRTSSGSAKRFDQALGIWITEQGALSAYLKPPVSGNLNMLLWNNKAVFLKNR
jgi:hypothetical protein